MNKTGMIRQYLMLLVVLGIAAFIVMQLSWQEFFDRGNTMPGRLTELVEPSKVPSSEISSSDLRAGGISGSRSTGSAFKSSGNRKITAASSSPFTAPTSTPFQIAPKVRRVNEVVQNRTTRISSPGEPKPVDEAANLPTTAASKNAITTQNPEGNSLSQVFSNFNISGRILNVSGEPIAGLALSLKLRQAKAEDKAIFGNRILNTQSDEKGMYSFLNLVEGEYQLCTIESASYKAACQTPRPPHSSADFSLRSLSGGRVYGEVKDEQGEALAQVLVSATPGQSNRATTNDKGQYTLSMSVNAEVNYQLYFTKKDYTRERISVKGSDILSGHQVDAALKQTKLSGFNVAGTIYDQSGSPVSGRMISLYSPTIKSSVPLRASSGANGEFVLKYVVASDDYRLSVSTGGGYTFDAEPYNSMQLFDGMPALRLEVQSAGKGSFSARVVSSEGFPITGETFALYSGSAYVGRSSSDSGGEIKFEEVPVKSAGSSLRLSGGSAPKYTFSGVTLSEGEHKSGLELVVDRGQSSLAVTVVDKNQTAIQGAQAVLIWTQVENGIRSQTMRSRGKTSMVASGLIQFSELGPGEHRLQVRKKGFMPNSTTININQASQSHKVVMTKADTQS